MAGIFTTILGAGGGGGGGVGGNRIRPPDDFGDDIYQHAQAFARAGGNSGGQTDVVAAAVSADDLLDLDQPKPQPVASVIPKDYDDVAGALGFAPKMLVQQRLVDILAELGIPTYDYAKVDAYMRTLRAKAKADIWCWRPLRDADRSGVNDWGANREYVGGVTGTRTTWLDGSYAAGRPHSTAYDRLVPKRPLQRALAISKALGDKVAFFVSDFASPKVEISDPFILVVMRRDPSIRAVFDVWNEPGFDTPPEG